MAVNTPIDVTPNYTVSTLQFQQETVNIIITSLLAVFILSNIGSVISKLVYFTRETRFSYESWVRAFIFANSDDPVRMFLWTIRRYIYREHGWKRKPQKYRLQRAIIPVLARLVIVICSIASVAITIPGEKRIDGCRKGDYIPKINLDNARIWRDRPQSICQNVLLNTRRGTVLSTASFCECPVGGSDKSNRTNASVYVVHDPGEGTTEIAVSSKGAIAGMLLYIEWKPRDGTFKPYRTNMAESLELDEIGDVLVKAIASRRPACTKSRSETDLSSSNNTIHRVILNCVGNFELNGDYVEDLTGHFWTSIEWKETDQKQKRIRIDGPTKFTPADDCPISVSITRPIVNIIPLAIALILFFLVNVIVSISVSKHGNALDAGFHIIKEILGHDTTSNPLEEPEGHKEIMEVELRNWVCSGGGGHVGFIGRHGDRPVAKFDDSITVAECTRAAIELSRAKARYGEPVEGSTDSSQAGDFNISGHQEASMSDVDFGSLR